MTAVLFALLLPVLLGLGAIVLAVGNWYTHARHLQTKVDAAAFAGGSVWGIPCGDPTTGSSAKIATQARIYVGPHTMADGTPSPYNANAYNPQVGNPAPASKIHVVLNGNGFWTDSSSPADLSDGSALTGICDSMHLDAKATEDNASLIFSLIPFFPDIKRKARVEIQQIEGLNGLLPIAVRVPKPISAAAAFFSEGSGTILAAKYFCKNDNMTGLPAGLGGWTTYQSTNSDPNDPDCSSLPNVSVGPTTGVAIVTSFRPACGTGTPPVTSNCLSLTGFSTVNDLCRQGNGNTAQCYYSDPSTSGSTQNVMSGLQFIRGYATGNVTTGPPELRKAWLDSSSCTGGYGSGYFSAATGTCSALFHADVDIGTAPGRTNGNTDVKYGFVFGDTVQQGIGNCPGGGSSLDGQDRPNCDMTGGSSASASVTFDPYSKRNSLVIRVRLKNTTIGTGPGATDCGNNYSATCQWFFTANGSTTNWPKNQATLDNIFSHPVQRSFMGDLDSSGSVKFLRLATDTGSGSNCDGIPEAIDADGASVPSGAGHNCFYLDMGLQGGLSKTQSDPPIQLNIGVTSQSSVLDCDPNIPNLKDEVVSGCQTPFYAANEFNTTPLCPGTSQFFTTPKAAPFDNYPPFRCVLTQTSNAANQLMQGLDERLFGVQNNPTCPTDDATKWVRGRNYWSDANNLNDDYTFANASTGTGNRLRADDPRLVNLFFTPYNSFTGNGNQTFPVVGFGSFYITGYGRFNGNGPGATLQIEDPCPGNTPPSDIVVSQGTVVWGNFVNEVRLSSSSTPSGTVCKVFELQPCVAVLVQ